MDVLGKSAIVLVPEIALTPQTVDRFRAVFGDRIAVLHSGLSDGEPLRRLAGSRARTAAHRRRRSLRRSSPPLADLGAIVVDEEHESTYKQGEAPRYHAREVALVRARAEARSGRARQRHGQVLESWVNAAPANKYTLLSPPRSTCGGGVLPDGGSRGYARRPDPRLHLPRLSPDDAAVRLMLSEPLERGITARLSRGEQSILLLNRRGATPRSFNAAPAATCRRLSQLQHQPHLSSRAHERLICHYCRHSEAPHKACANCGGGLLNEKGMGTQQVERLC